jgi:serine/threonine protein kinase
MNESSPGLFTAKIGDWGSARAIAISGGGMNSMTQGIGTTCWLAPEVIEHAHASMASDVYAFGIILWEVMTRKEVFVGLTANQIIARVVKSELRPTVPEDCLLAELMQSCWAQNPADRPAFKHVTKLLSDFYDEEYARMRPDNSRNNY